MGNYDKAILAYDKALELDPNFIEAWYYKGVDLDGLGNHSQALKAYEKATELDPENDDAWNNMG